MKIKYCGDDKIFEVVEKIGSTYFVDAAPYNIPGKLVCIEEKDALIVSDDIPVSVPDSEQIKHSIFVRKFLNDFGVEM